MNKLKFAAGIEKVRKYYKDKLKNYKTLFKWLNVWFTHKILGYVS